MRSDALRNIALALAPAVVIGGVLAANALAGAGGDDVRSTVSDEFVDLGSIDRLDDALSSRKETRSPAELVVAAPPPTVVEAPPAPTPSPTPVAISAMAGGGIPAASLAAYQRAAASLAVADPGCHLEWTLLAAIGRVESGHGRSGISVVLANGRSEPPIIGNQLNGAGPFAEILDTDDGAMDADLEYDRAVGPMQFLPGTWRSSGRDGDGDGVKDVHDIDDAALAAGVYLCAGETDLAQPDQIRGAIWRYNHSEEYVNTVLGIMAAYAAAPPPTVPNATEAPVVPVEPLPEVPVEPASPVTPAEPTPSAEPTSTGSETPTESPTPTETPTPTPTESPSGTESPTPTPTATPTPTETPTP